MDDYKNYIDDCIKELIERATESKKAVKENKDDFKLGYNMAYYEVVSYLIAQAEAFNIRNSLSKEIQNVSPESLL